MSAQRKDPEELRERAVKMVSEIRGQDGKGRPALLAHRAFTRRTPSIWFDLRPSRCAWQGRRSPPQQTEVPDAERATFSAEDLRLRGAGRWPLSRPAVPAYQGYQTPFAVRCRAPSGAGVPPSRKGPCHVSDLAGFPACPPRWPAPGSVTAGLLGRRRAGGSRVHWRRGLGYVAFFGLTNQVNGFQRMTVPGTATVHVAQAATRVLYFEGPRTAPPSGQLGIQVTGPAGNPVVVSAYRADLRYDVPGESGRAGKAIASFQAAAAGDYQISAGPGTSAAGTIAVGGDVLWDVVPHIAGAAAVFLAGVAAGGALIIVTAVRRSGRRAAGRNTP